MATVACVRLGELLVLRCIILLHSGSIRRAAYHLGGICTIVVVGDNGSGGKGPYHGAFPNSLMRLAS
jgi:hypothetical protein